MRVDELARDVGISKRTLYEQFRTKEEMAQEALARLTAKLHEAIEEIRRDDRGEPERLRAVVFRVCQSMAKARPPFFRDLETTPALQSLVEDCRAKCFTQVEALVREGIANGTFRAEIDPRLVRRTLVAAVSSVFRPEVLAEDRLTLEQAFDGVFELLLRGLIVPAEP